MRVRILGGPGSDKTTLGKALSKTYKIPHYDLDKVFWADGKHNYQKTRSEKDRDKLVKQMVQKKSWVIEGTQGTEWSAATYEKADSIILLEVPKTIRAIRILKRAIVRTISKQGQKETPKSVMKLLRWNWRYDKKNLAGIKEAICKHEHKILVIKKPRPSVEDTCLRK